MTKHCTRCHKKTTDLTGEFNLCKGCNYQVQQVMDFLEHQGYGVQRLMFPNGGDNPPNPPESTEDASKQADMSRSTRSKKEGP